MLEGEPLEERFTQPSMGTSQPVEVGQVGNHHHLSFTCFCRTWLQEVREVESAWGKPGAWGPTKAWLRFFSVSRVAPWRPGSDPLIPRPLLHVLEEGEATALDLHFQEARGPPASPSSI